MTKSYELFRIPVPPSEDKIIKYSQLRLLGLKTNPEAFSSTFEQESLNTHEVWRTRIDNEERFTIIARLADNEEWVGTASILTPEMMMRLYPTDWSSRLGAHLLVGMWVHPEHRRKGVGKKLLEFGIAWVRTRTEGIPDAQKRIGLEVHSHNEDAMALYHGLGFVEAKDEESEDPKRIPMLLVAK
ncbi:acyl-CoA N-acyltransferase [Mycena capillaripes]|nr:acyl-CoA N-acyltransferase [Mycena capillaripes]